MSITEAQLNEASRRTGIAVERIIDLFYEYGIIKDDILIDDSKKTGAPPYWPERTPPELRHIRQGHYDITIEGQGPELLETHGLGPCIALIVTGKNAQGQKMAAVSHASLAYRIENLEHLFDVFEGKVTVDLPGGDPADIGSLITMVRLLDMIDTLAEQGKDIHLRTSTFLNVDSERLSPDTRLSISVRTQQLHEGGISDIALTKAERSTHTINALTAESLHAAMTNADRSVTHDDACKNGKSNNL